MPQPVADEVVVRMEAAPLNPSDIGAMIGPADVSRATSKSTDGYQHVVLPIPAEMMKKIDGKIGQRLPAGIEGAGVVVAAGAGAAAQQLIGRVVSISTGATYSEGPDSFTARMRRRLRAPHLTGSWRRACHSEWRRGGSPSKGRRRFR